MFRRKLPKETGICQVSTTTVLDAENATTTIPLCSPMAKERKRASVPGALRPNRESPDELISLGARILG